MNDESRPKAAPETPAKKSTTSVTRTSDEIGRDATFDIIVPVVGPCDAYIGALLHLPAVTAVTAARYVAGSDLDDERHRVILELAVALADRGIAPDPAAIFGEAQSTGRVAGAHRLGVLSKLLSDLYVGVSVPASVHFYASSVIAAAVRRRMVEASVRIAQAADECEVREAVDLARREALAVSEAYARLEAHAHRGAIDTSIETGPARNFWDALDATPDEVLA